MRISHQNPVKFFMAANREVSRHKNTHQELQRIHQNTQQFSDNLLFRIIRITELITHIIFSGKVNAQSLLIIMKVE